MWQIFSEQIQADGQNDLTRLTSLLEVIILIMPTGIPLLFLNATETKLYLHIEISTFQNVVKLNRHFGKYVEKLI